MKILAKNWRARLVRSYSSLSIISNILVALSISGLSVLGILTSEFALTTLLILGIPLGILGLLGRVIDQGLDDVVRDKSSPCNCKKVRNEET
jgi:hypothetical protein